jgi:integrase
VTALKASLAKRRTPNDEAHRGLVFITAALGSFSKTTTDSPITKEFAKLVKSLELKQKGRGFYSLRHTFRTVARHAQDLEAARQIMRHVSGHVEEDYLEEPVSDERLRKVSDHLRAWLYPPKPAQAKAAAVKKNQTNQSTTIRVVG